MLGKPLDCGGERAALFVLTDGNELSRGVGVINAHDVLLDDWTLIEVVGDKVCRRSDELHATSVGLLIRIRALETGQERVVNVDDLAGELGAQFGRENLHVASQNDELDVICLDDLEDALLKGLLFCLGLYAVVLKRNPVELGEIAQVGVVAHDERNLNGQLSGALAEKHVVDAVSCCGGEHEGAQPAADEVDLGGHPILFNDRLQGRFEGFTGARGLDLEAHEEAPGVIAGELLAFCDVSAGGDDSATDGVHDSRLVDAHKSEDPVGRVTAHTSRLLVQALVDWHHRNWRLDGFPSGSDMRADLAVRLGLNDTNESLWSHHVIHVQ